MSDAKPDLLPTGQHFSEPSEPFDRTAHHSNTRISDGPPHELQPTGVIPGYEIVAELGRGGMGVVYRARQITLHREVAIKTILRADVARSAIAQFWAEAEVMAAVKHPHVVQVFELGEHDGRPDQSSPSEPPASPPQRALPVWKRKEVQGLLSARGRAGCLAPILIEARHERDGGIDFHFFRKPAGPQPEPSTTAVGLEASATLTRSRLSRGEPDTAPASEFR